MSPVARSAGYDGTTKDAWTSKSRATKGKVYAIAPMIADAQDHIYDSGVVIGPMLNPETI